MDHLEDSKEQQKDSVQIYSNPSNVQEIYKTMLSEFEKIYKQSPIFIARAPGRVNLIGEHIDYMGYGVFPFALDQDAVIAINFNETNQLIINHIDSQKFPQVILDTNPNQPKAQAGCFYNYFLAGYQAILSEFRIQEFKGLNILLTGNVPLASGLSSSSALTVCSAVATLASYNLQDKIESQKLCQLVIDHERMLGTACGGMDQTISILGKMGKAMYVTFDPIKAEPIQLPNEVTFVIANSLQPSPKMETLGTRYNKRVSECRFAIRLIAKELKIDEKDLKNIKTLQELQLYLKNSLEQMIELIQQNYVEQLQRGYTREEIQDQIGYDIEQLILDVPSYEMVFSQNKEFFPYQRALHVYEESLRVQKFRQLCLDELVEQSKKIDQLGQLMHDSQTSCKQNYDCSSENLDKFMDIVKNYGKQFGVKGSRLTGAGWGGCCVTMVENQFVDDFISFMKEKFYKSLLDLDNQDLSNYIFSTKPGNGAAILQVNDNLFN